LKKALESFRQRKATAVSPISQTMPTKIRDAVASGPRMPISGGPMSTATVLRPNSTDAMTRRRQPPQVVGNELIVVVINHRRVSCSGLRLPTRRLVGRGGFGQWVLGRAGEQLIDAVAQLPPGAGEIGESLLPGRGEPVVPAGRPGR